MFSFVAHALAASRSLVASFPNFAMPAIVLQSTKKRVDEFRGSTASAAEKRARSIGWIEPGARRLAVSTVVLIGASKLWPI
jgi:hypothetical protein